VEKLRGSWQRIQANRLQVTLILSFSLIAALIISAAMLITLRVIRDYLDREEFARVQRGMALAQAIYQDYMVSLISAARRVAVHAALRMASSGPLDDEIRVESEAFPFEGNRFIIVLDEQGNALSQSLFPVLHEPTTRGNWANLPLVADVLAQGRIGGTTEVIPVEYLGLLGLDKQAHTPIKDTPKAAAKLFDPREGHAGLALVGTAPITGAGGKIIGAVLVGHLLNNDFALVDRVKDVGRLDTVTAFFGDLRVSTNVLTAEGERAVGTRISKEVGDVVLVKGDVFEERAFVVKEWYITRYEPLRDHRYQVVGSLYVGMREAYFLGLVWAFNERILFIAFVSVVTVFLIAIPVARSIVKPLVQLAEASRRVAEDDLTVRVPVNGHGELAMLARSFNEMVAALQNAREELLRKEKLASVGQLAAGVAHEINNPLGTVLLYADLLRKGLPPNDPRWDDLKMIIDEAMRCKSIVGDLLNFARQRQLTAKPSDINALVSETLEEVSIQPDFQEVEIITDLDAKLPLVQMDEAQIRQVFLNLILNAGEAMEGRGRLTVTSRLVPGDIVEVSFQDTGCGIPEEHMKELFTPFFTTKPVGEGTGLGLSIVYGIVKMHQGQITVRSKVGAGSTFTVTLPVRQPGRGTDGAIG